MSSVKATDFPQLQACLTSNAEWAARTHKEEPDFFERSAKGQKPFLLWIGCEWASGLGVLGGREEEEEEGIGGGGNGGGGGMEC
jgi:hypothetical protein